MIGISLGWVVILIIVAFMIGVIFGIKLGIRWVKRKPEEEIP